MKKYFSIFFILTVILCFTACTPVEYDESLLYGKWVSGTEYYRYDFGGTGATWDTSDDVSEEEAQEFTWTLNGTELTHIHIMEMGGSVPKTYTVTGLTSTTLQYKDYIDKKFSYTKVTDYDVSLLYGKWANGTEYYLFNSDGTGATWDTSEGGTEEEPQRFTWSFKDAKLTFIMETGGSLPKTYTVTKLTSTTLQYKGSADIKFSFTKVN